MTMVDLVLLACSLNEPTSCREHHLYREMRGDLMHCMMQAPTEIAKWSGEHPRVQVKRWKCVFPDGSRHI